MLLDLFLTFFKIGFISFGGGYAMMPIIQHEVSRNQWLSAEDFNQVVSLAGTGPGPIATNCATLIGFETAGIPGAIMATLGMVLPSLLLIILLAAFLYKWHNNKWFKSSFYGLKPVVTGLIFFAAIHFGMAGWGEAKLPVTWQQIATILITVGAFVGIVKYKLHPFIIIVGAGIMGIVFFQ
ncbi:chromate transporter [Paenibacillus aceris]|uniref:Chromate transporter n=1 Tax=Paenibacillus aceris TaxID=869555 RepID=A0ABS4HW70_9BACL|nr:chromate transporter [Paenibacillus aceris]MBP1962199.1 chromate transporter [Paenibacillus aceris]NHW33956.1 chromate transporter [Paenibacillus aceris]